MPSARLRDATVHFDVHGRGPDVLLLPPAGTRSAIWDRYQVPALVAAGYRVTTVEARGTQPGTAARYAAGIDDLVDDVVAVMDLLALPPSCVVGSSLGAMIAQELLITHPQRVRGAVLVGTRGRCDAFRSRMARAQAERLRTATVADFTDLDALTQLATLFGAATLADDVAVADWFSLIRTFPLVGPGPASHYAATVIADRRPALASVAAPCLVIGFAEDVVTTTGQCREVAAALPDGRYVEIAGCGHFGFIERPDEVNEEIVRFLKELA